MKMLTLLVVSAGLAHSACAQCEGTQLRRFEPLDLAPGDQFGADVYISGSRVAIGAPYSDYVVPDSGAAYVFDMDSGEQLHKLVPDDPAEGSRFGQSVCISPDWIAVGAYRADDNAGAVYIFHADTGLQVRKLVAPNRAPGDYFGWDVRIDGDTVAIAAPGADAVAPDAGAVFTFDMTNGQLMRTFTASDAAEGDSFGSDLAVHGSKLLVGASNADTPSYDSGAAYLFELSTGEQLRKFIADDGTTRNWLGDNVDFNDDYALIAGTGDRDGLHSGSAYFFDLHTGDQISNFHPSLDLPYHQFGASLSMSGSVALVGDLSSGGYCFAYEVPSGRELASFRNADGASDIGLGRYSFIDGTRVMLGAMKDDSACAAGEDCNSGAAFLFTLPPDLASCPAELNNDCRLDFFDVQQFLNLFAAHDPAADLTADGVFDFFDVQGYLDFYSAGCP